MISLPENIVNASKQEAERRGATFSGFVRYALLKELAK